MANIGYRIKAARRVIIDSLQHILWQQKMQKHFYAEHIASNNYSWVESRDLLETDDRAFWINVLGKIAFPVMSRLAKGELKKTMPIEKAAQYFMTAENVTYLEAIGRTFAGIAPWLALPDDSSPEGVYRQEFRQIVVQGLKNSVDPESPDCINFMGELQTIVDAAYLAHGFLRSKTAVWDALDPLTQKRFITAFKSLRNRTGAYNNWLVFAGLIETFLLEIGEEYDPARIKFSIEKMKEWYVGDGWFSDGPHFSMDYYNSFVIHPMMTDMLEVLARKKQVPEEYWQTAMKRMVRHAEFLERSIMPDGTFPPIGRSITYRTGAFQALSQVALMKKLPGHINPAQVRAGLTKVMRNMFALDHNFDEQGWLVLGFNGFQPMVADTYTSTGSLYMASLVLLPLGLPPSDEFWHAPAAPWTSAKAWAGVAVVKDYKVEY